MQDQLLRQITAALELSEGDLAPDTRIDAVVEWDSIGWLTILAVVDENYGVELDGQAIRGMKTAGDLIAYVIAHAKS